MNPFSEERKPEINYPCEWGYKIIGTDIDMMLEAVEEAAAGIPYEITPSNISKNGKYFSLNMKLIVPNETIRDVIYATLKNKSGIKFVF